MFDDIKQLTNGEWFRLTLAVKPSASVASWAWTFLPQLDPSGLWETSSLGRITLSLTMAMSVWALQRQPSSPMLPQVGLQSEAVATRNTAHVLFVDQGC